MANRAGKKGKKPLQTTLGKAVSPNEKDVDVSHIQKPINTSVFGLRQVLSLFQTATKEVQNYITYECDIMYECRTCRNIFRSLANFILHKREYCRERFINLDHRSSNEDVSEVNCLNSSEKDLKEQNKAPEKIPPDKKDASNSGMKKSLIPVIERLKEKQEICQLAHEVLNQDLSSKETEEPSDESDKKSKNDLLLEEIATNNAAVFQTVLRNLPRRDTDKPEFMKSEVMEIHGILDSDEAVLGPDGKICTFETNKINNNPIIPKNDLFCTECHLKFSTKKTLTYHIKYKHNNTRLVYICPDCKDTFANAWCVYRHLYKVHRRTSAQIKRMREQIHNSCVRKDQEPIKKKDKKNLENTEKADEENQWLSNIEGDNDFQMCGGCGKRFERKAALHSHAQMCTKRIAVCNTIKENNAKRKEEELNKDLKNKTTKVEKVEVLKGSLKRKPYLLRTYKCNETESRDGKQVLSNEESEDTCDVNANCEIVETNCDRNKDNEEEKVMHRSRNSLSSTEDLLSPSKNDFVSSPSIEKIDTEKMLSIIGISTSYDNVTTGGSRDEPRDEPRDETRDELKEEPGVEPRNEPINEPKNTHPNADPSPEENISKESSRSHTVSDFDLFCENVAKSLLTEDKPIETEDSPQKIPKTVPLILRRRNNSSKCEKRNIILEQNSETLQNDLLNENEKKCPVEKENIAQINDSAILDSSPSSSNFKISVKSLEDLIGVSPEDHIKNSESIEFNQATDNEMAIRKTTLDLNNVNFEVSVYKDIPDTLKANVSPEKLNEKYTKCLKRKRTSSFDFSECSKFSKTAKKFFSSKQDKSFITRASPFMDQNKLLCIPCQMAYPTLSKLLWHMSAHFSWFRFQCSRCSFISFNKLDCANHARNMHYVKKASIQSVVLPIPNWKTVLMSHDFCMLDDENDLSGKHTDEILSGNSEEGTIEDSNENIRINDCEESEESDWTSRLFVESQNIDSDPETDPLEPDIPLGLSSSFKQENIDVVEDAQESFQIEVPQEIYTLDVSEIIDGVHYEERCRSAPQIKTERYDEDDEDISLGNCIPAYEENEIFFDEIGIKTEPTDEICEEIFSDRSEEVNNPYFKEISEPAVKKRPTRNRTRSIKTIQDDFFYDLNKVIKLNDTSVNKSNLQKQKKSQKNKDSMSSNGKNETRPIRVYSKRK